MPHAETNNSSSTATMSAQQMTNGDKPSSLFLNHLGNYPVVHDAVSTYKTNPYGAKTLDIAQIAYDRIAAPFMPYLRTPYSILHPYLSKADTLADTGLNKVDETFPVVKEDTNALRGTAIQYALFPLRLAGEGKDYVFRTYADEHNKVGGEGLVRTAKAFVSTELKIAYDTLNYGISLFARTREQAKHQTQHAREKAGQTATHLRSMAEQTTDQARQMAGQTANQASQMADDKADQARQVSNHTMEQARQMVDQTTEQARQTAEQARQSANQTSDQVSHKADQKTSQAQSKAEQAKQKANQKAY